MNRSGEYVRNMTGEAEYRSFRPSPLPPEPALEMDEEFLRLLVEDQNKAQELLSQAGFVVKNTPVLIVPVSDRPGGLAAILAALDKQNINVLYMYAFPAGQDGKAMMVFRLEDPEKAMQVLAEAGVPVQG